MSETEIGYFGSPLSNSGLTGRRLDPRRYGGVPPGSGTAPRWVLYATDAEHGAALAERFPTLLEASPRVSEKSHELMIVRPDAYVGLAAHQEEWNKAEAYLGQLSPYAGRDRLE